MERYQLRQKVDKLYGRRIHLANQPIEGPRRQAQNQIMQNLQKTHQPEIKNEQVHGPG